MEGNQYFSQHVKQLVSKVTEEELIKRSKECQFILDNLTTNEVWKIVLNDCKKMCRHLDNNWQEQFDEKQLLAMRSLKFAYDHIFNLPNKYKEEFKYVVEELRKRESPEVIDKDYDTETIFEE
jgi:hypothetical protein